MTGEGRVDRKTENWSSRFGFIMAAIGSSVGLGNFWRFPYMAGEGGGGAFLLAYLACLVLIATPLLAAEYAVGRRSGHSAIESVQSVARASSRSQTWGVVGWVGVFAAFFILSFYTVVSSWLMAYIPFAWSGELSDATPEAALTRFNAVTGDVGVVLGCLFLFIAAIVLIVGRGVRRGVERAAIYLMPVFFAVLVMLLAVAAAEGEFARAWSFLTTVHPGRMSFETLLDALGQSLFSTGVGAAVMITYGAYLTADTNIPRSAAIVAGADTLVAVIAALVVFSLVFTVGGDPAAGPSLFFISLPLGFPATAAGAWVAGAFFTLALFAALASSISLMEAVVSWLEERQGVTRFWAAVGVGAAVFVIGGGYVFSHAFIAYVDFITASVLMPLGGFLMALFAGWAVSEKIMKGELGAVVHRFWLPLVRWVAPALIGVILVMGVADKMQNRGWIEAPGWLAGVLGPNP